jgi:serine protease Do
MKTFSVISPVFVVVSCYFWAVGTTTGFANETREDWATKAYRKNCESVVFIQGDKVEERRGGAIDTERTFNGMGSGIIIDERGYIVTNYHVVKDIRKIQVKTHDDKDFVATLVAKDTDTDLAIIKIPVRTPLKPITFGRSNDLMVGESCIAIGNPYGYVFSLTDGRISAINRDVNVNDSSLVYRASTQTNTEINPGNSGGPLINVLGEMIGINVAIRQGANGIAFATPVDKVVEVAAKLIGDIANQHVIHGLTVSQVEPAIYDAKKGFIIRVESVESNSPAALAGIQKGDFLTGIGKYPLRNKLDFYRALLDLKANDEIAFSYTRNKESFDVNVAMGGAARNGAFAQRPVQAQPAAVTPSIASNATPNAERPTSRSTEFDRAVWENLGIQYAPIPAQEFERTFPKFLVDAEGKIRYEGGVVVKAVREGSPAEQACLTTGDVIVTIGPWKTTSANDIRFVGAQEWKKLQAETGNLKTHVIRDNTHYVTEIPMKVF